MTSLPGVLAALGEPTRFRLVKLLLERDLCVGALARELGVSKPAVSQHLKKLKEAGLVAGERRGYWIHYAVKVESLLKAADCLKDMASAVRWEEGECGLKSSCGCCSTGKKSILPDFRTPQDKGR